MARALDVYKVYAIRSDPLANVRLLLPPSVRIMGFMATEDDIEVSLWRPFGSRQVKDILLSDSVEEIRRRNIEYIVVGGFNLTQQGMTLEAWLARTHAEWIAKTKATVKVAEGEQPWYVVRLRD